MIKLLSSQSGVGRTVRGFLQAIVGMSAFFSLVVADPNFASFVSSSPYATVLTSGSFVALVAAIHNFAEYLLSRSSNN